VVDMCGNRSFICYSRKQDHLLIKVFVSLEQETYDDWLRKDVTRRESEMLEQYNLKDMHLQFSNGGNLTRSLLLKRNRALHVRRHGPQREEAGDRTRAAGRNLHLPRRARTRI